MAALKLFQLLEDAYKNATDPISECRCSGVFTIPIPITKIDGVDVHCELEGREGCVGFEIDSTALYDGEEGEPINLYRAFPFQKINNRICDRNALIKWCNEVLDELSKLKLCIDGRLRADCAERDAHLVKVYEIFGNIPNTECALAIDQCCVCHNSTQTKTQCKHSLCYRCWGSVIDSTLEDGDDDQDIPCPLCRADIRYV